MISKFSKYNIVYSLNINVHGFTVIDVGPYCSPDVIVENIFFFFNLSMKNKFDTSISIVLF